MHLLQKFLPGKTFAPIVTRDFRPPKPDPAGILHIAREWELEDGGNGLIMVLWVFFILNYACRWLTELQVGDSIDDMTAGHKAGSATVLLANESNQELKDHEHTGAWIDRLDEIIELLESGFEERSKE